MLKIPVVQFNCQTNARTDYSISHCKHCLKHREHMHGLGHTYNFTCAWTKWILLTLSFLFFFGKINYKHLRTKLSYNHRVQWRIQGDPLHPPTDQIFLNFMQFLGKSGKFVCCAPPPRGMARPPMGNPGSVPGVPLTKSLVARSTHLQHAASFTSSA